MAIIGHGSSLNIGTATPSGGPWTGTGETSAEIAIACTSIDLGSNKVDTPDVTDMATTGNTRVFIGALENPGDLSIKYNVKPGDAGQAALEAARAANVPYDFAVSYPGGVRIIKFSGIVTSIDETIPDDKPATGTAKIQISGPKAYSPTGN